ncbi:MAG: antitoxin VapB family protein [Thermoplasmatales archaeon]
MLKTITIKKSAYYELIALKKENESFCELLDRLVRLQSRKDLISLMRGTVEFEEKEKLLMDIEKKRREKRNWFIWT